MNLTDADLAALAELAVSAAREAGALVASSRPSQIGYKAVGASLASQVVTEVDQRSQAIIVDRLAPTLERHGLGLLTEEREDDGGRLVAEYFWCIDPLDGTLPFIEGLAGYAVSIALVRRDGHPCIGVAYDPVAGTMFSAIAGRGIWRNGTLWSQGAGSPNDRLSVFADRSFAALDDHDAVVGRLEKIAGDLGLAGLHLRSPAGAVMNACGVLENGPACYFKFPKASGGGSLWDFAATAALFREAGAIATDIHGAVLDLNRADSTFMNHNGVVFATNEAVASQIRSLRPKIH